MPLTNDELMQMAESLLGVEGENIEPRQYVRGLMGLASDCLTLALELDAWDADGELRTA